MLALCFHWALGLAAFVADARVLHGQKAELRRWGLLPALRVQAVGRARALRPDLARRPRVALQHGPRMQAVSEAPPLVLPADCPSCEEDYLERSKEFETKELIRLRELAANDRDAYLAEVWRYGRLLSDYQRAQLMLGPDVATRKFILESSTPPTPFMDNVYRSTLQRVQYEDACYLCAPEQAMLLRTIAAFVQPRHALDIGSFTGYSSSAVLEAIPATAELTCLEAERDYARFGETQLSERNANFIVGKAMQALESFERQGRQFDFIVLDADKPMYKEYYEMALKLLRPGGVLVMFGLILFTSPEDQNAMDEMHKILADDERVNTVLMPVGCGLQLAVKKDSQTTRDPLSAVASDDRRQYSLESELAALDRAISGLRAANGPRNWGPGLDVPSSAALVAQAGPYQGPLQPEGDVAMQFNFLKKAPKESEQAQGRRAWERGDVFRPGKSNWFHKQQTDLTRVHAKLQPHIEQLPEKSPARGESRAEPLLGSLLKQLTLGDLAVTLCSKEPAVLKTLREWLMKPESGLSLEEAVEGLPQEQGNFISTIANAMDARRILDLGTFTGYSSIALALATAPDARIVCCEPNEGYSRKAQRWWREAGVAEKMEMHEVRAEELLQRLLDEGRAGSFDMVFVDVGERDRYSAIHELALELLRVGGTVVYYSTLWAADETLNHSYYPALRAFAGNLSTDPRVLASLIPLSYGMTVAVKVLSADGKQLAAARDGGPSAVADVLRERRSAVAEELGRVPAR